MFFAAGVGTVLQTALGSFSKKAILKPEYAVYTIQPKYRTDRTAVAVKDCIVKVCTAAVVTDCTAVGCN